MIPFVCHLLTERNDRSMLVRVGVAALFILFSGYVFGQQPTALRQDIHFVHLGVNDGLSQSSVLSITQDKQGFMWFGTRDGLSKYNTRTFDIYRNTGENVSLLSNHYISSLLTDQHNVLWIGTVFGLTKYDIAQNRFEHVVHDPAVPRSISGDRIHDIVETASGEVWIGTANGLNQLDDRQQNAFNKFLPNIRIDALAMHADGKQIWVGSEQGITLFSHDADGHHIHEFAQLNALLTSLPSGQITSMVQDYRGTLWISLQSEGLIALDITSGDFQHYVEGQLALPSNNVRKIIVDRDGKLWAGTLKGLSIIDPIERTGETYQYEPDNPNSLSQNSIYDIYEDRQGVIWIGTYYSGISAVFPKTTPFQVLQSSQYFSSLSSNVISAIVEDTKGNLWVGTEAEGLNYYDRERGTFQHYQYQYGQSNSMSSNLIKTLYIDRGELVWIGTFAGGLNVFDPRTGHFRQFQNTQTTDPNLTNNIYSLAEDGQGRLWVGTNMGLFTFDKSKGTFKLFGEEVQHSVIQCLLVDASDNVWAGTSNGLFKLEKNGSKFIHVTSPNTYIYALYEDKDGNIWAGTSQRGLYRYHPHSLETIHYTEADGLPGNTIHGILTDDDDRLWLSTNNGIYKLDTATRTVHHYTVRDGLPSNEFNYKSSYRDSRGQLFFGSLNGLVSFYPNQIAINDDVADVVFTGLRLFNRPVIVNDETRLLARALNDVDQITFKHSQNIFTIDFAVLNYIKPEKNQYAYRLDGFEKEWNYVDVPSATYTNLPAGHYTFMVKGANNDGLWNETPVHLHIKVRPPWWRTWWAYLAYFVVFAAVYYAIMRYLIMRALLKKEHEQHQAKLRFFSYISHEIRTPITLILAPLEKLLERARDIPGLQQQVLPIKNNANRLLRLVNELMDFRKIETSNVTLQVTESDIVAFTKEVMLAFDDIAQMRNITYTFRSDAEHLMLYVDKAQLEKVLFNLLSNAFKFVHEGGEVRIDIDETKAGAQIRVTDSGPGIPKEKQERLFTDFYQASHHGPMHHGSGIGLALAKSIALLHGGELLVRSRTKSESQSGRTTFILILPFGKAHLPPETIFQQADWERDVLTEPSLPAASPYQQVDDTTTQYTIVIAEDHPDLRAFLSNTLASQYRIIACEDGRDAWETITETLPDLVLSDVMMPNMDGLELCRKIKLDERTSHIPVVLLTAMATIEHQLSGLETGADAYIVKPFNVQLLELSIRNLIASKEALRKKFSQGFNLELPKTGGSRTDEAFLQKVLAIITENMDSVDFDVPFLADKVGMSQPILYKKIKAVTDLSVNNLIKTVRMKSAVKLLDEGALGIAEVAYAVGFNDRKYFSKEFKRMFGKSPSEHIKK